MHRLVALILLVPAAASAHGVDHVVTFDQAVIVEVSHHGGAPLAGADATVTAPGEEGAWLRTATDPAGRLSFLPDRRGVWRVAVRSADGHGAVVEVEVGPDLLPVGAAADSPARERPGLRGLLLAAVATILVLSVLRRTRS